MTEQGWDVATHVKTDGSPTKTFYDQLRKYLMHLAARRVGFGNRTEIIVDQTLEKLIPKIEVIPNNLSYWVRLGLRILRAEITKTHIKIDGSPTEKFYEHLINYLNQIVSYKVDCKEDVEDIVGQTMLKLTPNLEPNKLTHWVRLALRIVRAEIANHYRKKARVNDVDNPEFIEYISSDDHHDLEALLEKIDADKRVKLVAEKYLPHRDKVILSLTANGFSDSEIRDEIQDYGYDMTIKTIQNRRSNAIKQLRDMLR